MDPLEERGLVNNVPDQFRMTMEDRYSEPTFLFKIVKNII